MPSMLSTFNASGLKGSAVKRAIYTPSRVCNKQKLSPMYSVCIGSLIQQGSNLISMASQLSVHPAKISIQISKVIGCLLPYLY